VFIAVIFFTSKMAGKSEVIAILASGTSFNRFLRPYYVGGISLGVLLFFAAHYVIPKANDIRGSFESKYVNGNSTYDPLVAKGNDQYFRVDSFTYAGVRSYDTSRKSGGPFFMNKLSGNQVVYNLRADAIMWDTVKHKNKWVLHGVVERTINGLHETLVKTSSKDMNFNFKPFDLSRDEFAKDKLTTPELKHFIALDELRGGEDVNTFRVESYRRTATPVTVVILTFIGAVVAARKVRGGSGAHLAIGFLTAAAFIIMDRFSTVFSTKASFPPLIAAWVPNIVFVFVALYMYRKAPK
jgi:lipopolysaccharide export system permease protein